MLMSLVLQSGSEGSVVLCFVAISCINTGWGARPTVLIFIYPSPSRSQYRRTEKTEILKIPYQKEVEVRMEDPLQESTEITGESEEVQRDISHELLDWLQEFRGNLVDESTSTERRRRTGTVVPRTEPEHFGDLITADHKFLSEESESRNNHRYAVVVVQDLATQWIQSYPCETKTSQETQKSSRRGNYKSFTLTSPWNLACLARIFS